jgi:hypothetical protein
MRTMCSATTTLYSIAASQDLHQLLVQLVQRLRASLVCFIPVRRSDAEVHAPALILAQIFGHVAKLVYVTAVGKNDKPLMAPQNHKQ